VDFPAVTICSPGYNYDTLQAGFFKQVFDFYKQEKIPVSLNPFQAALAISKVNCDTFLKYLRGNDLQYFQGYAGFIIT